MQLWRGRDGLRAWWGPVLERVSARRGPGWAALASRAESAERGGDADDWRRTWLATFRGTDEVHGCRRIVDSSKTAGGHRRLALLPSVPDTRVLLNLHLVRLMGGVVQSFRQGGNRQQESG